MKLFFLILLWIPFGLFSQDELSKSILQFERSNSDFDKAKYASDLAWELKDINQDSSLYYAKKALLFSKKTGQRKLVAYSLSDIGNYYKRKENYSSALQHYKKSLIIRRRLTDSQLIASGYNQIGILFNQQEKYDSAAIYFHQGILTARNTDHSNERLALFNGYAMTLYHLDKSETALVYLDSAFTLANQTNDKQKVAKTIQKKGVINQYLGHNQLALKFYGEADQIYSSLKNVNGQIEVSINQASIFLTTGNTKKAEQLLLTAEERCIESGFEDNLFIIFTDLAQLYRKKDPKKRGIYLQKALANAIKCDKLPAQIETTIELGLFALETNQLNKALSKINEANQFKMSLTKFNRFNLFLLKSKYWEAKQNYKKALNYSKKALFTKDSLHQNLNHLQDMSSLLNNERYDKNIALQQLRTSEVEKKGIQTKLSHDRIIIGSLLVVVILIILLFLNRRERMKIEYEKSIQEEVFKTELMQKSHELDLLFLEESLQLETTIRQKIGSDLHDHLGSKLAVIQIRLDSMVKHLFSGNKEKNELNDIIGLVEKSCKDVRVISHDLIAHDFSKQSLDRSLKSHCHSISQSGKLNLSYALIGEPYPLPIKTKKNLYATITLLIDNIVQHAQADNSNLQLFYHDDCINVELDDDGTGFNFKESIRSGGVGINNAQKRIQDIQGTMEVDSEENRGTFISISVSFNHE